MHVQQMPIVTIREKMVSYSDEQIKDLIIDDFTGKRINILAPLFERERTLRNCSSKSKQVS
jgi:beta-lactamase class A